MELEKLLLQEKLDVKLLLQQSRVKGGFINSGLRRKIWPKLLGIDPYEERVVLVDGEGHRDKEQCECDVERSFQSILVGRDALSNAKVANRRRLLSRIIMTVLVRHPTLFYYQGLNDIFSCVILVVEDDSLAYRICEAISLRYLTDFMQADFKNVGSLMSLIFVLLEEMDPELSEFIKESEVQPFFATSWLVTWLSHDIKDLNKSSRVFDGKPLSELIS
jgi:TBC1 domain family member 20